MIILIVDTSRPSFFVYLEGQDIIGFRQSLYCLWRFRITEKTKPNQIIKRHSFSYHLNHVFRILQIYFIIIVIFFNY